MRETLAIIALSILSLFALLVFFSPFVVSGRQSRREDKHKPSHGWICLECHGIGAVYDDDTGLPMACPSCKGVRQ